jgi:hypothetical protein
MNYSELKQTRRKKMITERNTIYEGVLTPAGWDKLDNVNQTSLFTKEDEDILLKHSNGVNQFKPFLNQKVKVLGDIKSDSRNERTLIVRKITRMFESLQRPLFKISNQFKDMYASNKK